MRVMRGLSVYLAGFRLQEAEPPPLRRLRRNAAWPVLSPCKRPNLRFQQTVPLASLPCRVPRCRPRTEHRKARPVLVHYQGASCPRSQSRCRQRFADRRKARLPRSSSARAVGENVPGHGSSYRSMFSFGFDLRFVFRLLSGKLRGKCSRNDFRVVCSDAMGLILCLNSWELSTIGSRRMLFPVPGDRFN